MVAAGTKPTSVALITVFKVALVVIGFYAVFNRLWAAEDAYITFRYIDNWLHGYGLVYNVGDRVEGFTHPLWLFLITIPAVLGVSIRASALVLSLVMTVMSLILLAFFDRDTHGKSIAVPLGILLLVTNIGFRDFSVSGLEFPLACLLLVVFYQSYRRHDLLTRPYLHGALLSLLYLTRPELALLILSFYLITGIRLVALLRERRFEELRLHFAALARFSLPVIVIAGGYHLFRLLYYHEFFPNTYFAKDGLGAYWSAGLHYFFHFWRYSPILLVAVLASAAGVVFSRAFRKMLVGDSSRLIMVMQAALLTLYVVRLGGDFMAYRFLLPVMVILAVLMNDLLNLLIRSRKTMALTGAVIVAVTLLFTVFPIAPPQGVGYIANERLVYDLYHPPYRALFDEPKEHKWYRQGVELKALQEQTGYPLSVGDGNIGYLGYAAGPKVNIVDIYGLVDRQIARNPQLDQPRGRPGHEKKLSLQMAVDRNVTIYMSPFRQWNKIMNTPYGVITTLDPAFLRFLPDKIAQLKEYKRRVMSNELPRDDSFAFLLLLEQKCAIRVDDL